MSISPADAARAAGAAVLLALAGGAAWAQRGDVVASQLEDIDPLTVGALGPADGALPASLWVGSDLRGVADAAARALGETGHLAASELAARALASSGAAPDGPGERRTVALMRAEALLDLGRIDAVDSIVTATPQGLRDPELAAIAVRARLAKGEVTPACRVGEGLEQGRDGAFWLRLRAACFAWAEEASAAELTLTLARDADPDIADESFTAWVLAAGSGRLPASPPAPRDSLETALAISAGYQFPGDAFERLPLPAAAGLVRQQSLPAELRAEAALRAARAGAVDADALGDALDAVSLPGGTGPAERLEAGRVANRPTADALLRAAALEPRGGPYVGASAIDVALSRAESPAEFVALARLYAEPLGALEATPDLADIAPRLALAAAALGDRTLADRWLDPGASPIRPPAGFDAGPAFDGLASPFAAVARDYSNSPVEPTARIAAEAVVLASDPSSGLGALTAVAESRLRSTASAGEGAQAAARRDVLILLALGAEATPALRRAAATAAGEAPPVSELSGAALTAARLAAHAGALGETALYASEALGEAGPAHAPTAADVIAVLRAAGLGDAARAVAVETMLASRIAGAGGETN